MYRIAFLLVLATIAGCASTPSTGPRSSVGLSMILPDAAERASVRENELFLMPSPIEAGLPAFPSAAIGHAPASICAEIVVDEEGAVGTARQIDSSEGCERLASDASARFAPAVLDAVRQWTFAAAAICRYAENPVECDGDRAQLQVVPVKLAYRFDFVQQGDDGTVSRKSLGRRP